METAEIQRFPQPLSKPNYLRNPGLQLFIPFMLIFTRRQTDPPQKQASHHDRMKEERLGIDWAGMDALRDTIQKSAIQKSAIRGNA